PQTVSATVVVGNQSPRPVGVQLSQKETGFLDNPFRLTSQRTDRQRVRSEACPMRSEVGEEAIGMNDGGLQTTGERSTGAQFGGTRVASGETMKRNSEPADCFHERIRFGVVPDDQHWFISAAVHVLQQVIELALFPSVLQLPHNVNQGGRL